MTQKENEIYRTGKLRNALSIYSKVINKINVLAYQSNYLLSNGVLSRNTYMSTLLERLYREDYDCLPKRSKVFVIFRFCNYYLKSFIKLSSWLLQKFFFFLSGYRSLKLDKHVGGLILIDTYFVVPNLQKNDYRDKACLRGLDVILEKHGKNYSYLPVFCGDNNPFHYISIFNAFKKNDIDYITDYELLNLSDIAKIVTFIIAYPFIVMRLVRSLDGTNKEVALVKDELLLTINQVTWNNYARYLVGRRVGEKTNSAKLISWCEYQSIQKNLYKGVRDTNSSIKIFGCQFFLRFGDWVNIDIPSSEVALKLAPDVLLVNGKAALKRNSTLTYKLGASLRNKKIFERETINDQEDSNLFPIILLSYFQHESKKLLQLIGESEYKDKKLFVKAHPALDLASLRPFIRKSWVVVDGDLYDRLQDASIVIVTASGTAAEAVAIGKSVIIIGEYNSITTNPLLNLGKGMIWDTADTGQEVNHIANKLLEYQALNKEGISQISEKYRNLLFNNATENEILAMFDLV